MDGKAARYRGGFHVWTVSPPTAVIARGSAHGGYGEA